MEVLYCQDKDTKKKIKVTQLNNGIPLDVIKHVHISAQEFFVFACNVHRISSLS